MHIDLYCIVVVPGSLELYSSTYVIIHPQRHILIAYWKPSYLVKKTSDGRADVFYYGMHFMTTFQTVTS